MQRVYDGDDKNQRGRLRNGELTSRFSSLGTGLDAANSVILFLKIGGHK